ncbi:MAG: orotidine 5'-phosphate decarboxylase / HUMPS family protein [Fuerstiella sp.]
MTNPSIQIDFDSIDFFETLRLAEQVASHVDIFGVSNACVKHNGIQIVQALRRRFPDHKILVDLQTMDSVETEAAPFFSAGANICSVMGLAGSKTIEEFVKFAGIHGASAQVDLINAPDKVACANMASALGAHFLSVGSQLNTESPFADLQELAQLGVHSKLSVSGQIDCRTTQQAADAGAAVLAIASSVFNTSSPQNSALELRNSMQLAVA